MKKSANSLIGDPIRATDGFIGRVDDLIFNDKTWRIAYLVTRIGGLLSGKKVLLPLTALGTPDAEGIPVTYSKEQVMNSPGVEFDMPASNRETPLHEYLGYHTGLGGSPSGVPLPAQQAITPGASPLLQLAPRDGDSNILSVRDVVGYRIQATDGTLGHAEDFILDGATWKVAHVIAKFLWMRVRVFTNLINHVACGEEKLCLDASMGRIWRGPRIDTITRKAYAGCQ